VTRLPAVLLALGLAASAASAQQPPVLLRFNGTVNRTVRYRTEVDAWVRSPLLPAGDTAMPTMHILLWSVRTTDRPDSSGRIVFIDRTDSSHYDMPAIRAAMPEMATSGDLMRGMRTETRLDERGRGLTTRVLETPNMPQDLPVLVKGIQGLAVTTIRLGLFSLPDRPVEPGDTWNDSLRYDQQGAAGLQQTLVTAAGVGYATYRLERIETRAGQRVAVITSVAQINAGAQEPGQAASLQVSATATMDFNIDTGTLIRSQMDLSGPMATRVGVVPVRVRTALQAL
jgi:hypothetical protein